MVIQAHSAVTDTLQWQGRALLTIRMDPSVVSVILVYVYRVNPELISYTRGLDNKQLNTSVP